MADALCRAWCVQPKHVAALLCSQLQRTLLLSRVHSKQTRQLQMPSQQWKRPLSRRSGTRPRHQASAVPNGEHHADGAQANGEPDADPQPSVDADPQKPPERPSTVWRCLQCETAMPAQGLNNSGCEQQACERTRPLCVTGLRCRECSPFAWQCFAMLIAKHVDGPQQLQQPIKPPPYGVLWSRVHVYSLRRKELHRDVMPCNATRSSAVRVRLMTDPPKPNTEVSLHCRRF